MANRPEGVRNEKIRRLLRELKSEERIAADLYAELKNKTWVGRKSELIAGVMVASGIGMIIFLWLFLSAGKQDFTSWYFYVLCGCASVAFLMAMTLSVIRARIRDRFAAQFPDEYKLLKKFEKAP